MTNFYQYYRVRIRILAFLLPCLLFLGAGRVMGQVLQCSLPCAELINNNLSAVVPAYFNGISVNVNLNVASFFAQNSFSTNYLQSNFTPTLPAICSNHTGFEPRIRVQIAEQTTFNAWHGFFESTSKCIENDNMMSNVIVGNMVFNTTQDRIGASEIVTNTNFSINLTNIREGTYKIIARIGSNVAHGAFKELGTFKVMNLPTMPLSLTGSFQPMYQVVLNWQASSGTIDNYKIEKSTNNTTGFIEIATVQNNILTFTDLNPTQAKNTFYYRVRASNSIGNSPYSNTIIANLTTSIERQANWVGKVFPNPVEDKLFIEIPENHPTKTMVRLSSMQGKIGYSAIIEGRQAVIDVRNLPAGVYLLQIQQDKNLFIQKITKQ